MPGGVGLNLNRWLQFSTVFVLVFLFSVGAGLWLGRQRTDPPVASVPTPSPAPAALSTASLPPTFPPTPSAAPTSNSSPALPALDPPTAEEFADALLAAFQAGDTPYLLDRMHPLVFERYGERQCRSHVNGFAADPSASWTVESSSGPTPWEWETDGLTNTVSDNWTVAIRIPEEGPREIHFAPFEGTWRWFTDCGEPTR